MADFSDTSNSPDSHNDRSVATEREWAAINFEPWVHTDDEWKPPTNEQWAKLANPHLVILRIAWITMFKTKSEVMGIVRDLDEETGADLMDRFTYTRDFFKGMLAIMEGAEARIICAGTAHNLGLKNAETVLSQASFASAT